MLQTSAQARGQHHAEELMTQEEALCWYSRPCTALPADIAHHPLKRDTLLHTNRQPPVYAYCQHSTADLSLLGGMPSPQVTLLHLQPSITCSCNSTRFVDRKQVSMGSKSLCTTGAGWTGCVSVTYWHHPHKEQQQLLPATALNESHK
jgi:hypothetical protein